MSAWMAVLRSSAADVNLAAADVSPSSCTHAKKTGLICT